MTFDFASTKLRYVVGGAWNATVGSLVFAAIWLLLGTSLSIWAVTLIAHSISTTHSFFVQRQFVFRQTDGNVWHQFCRFQIAFVFIGVLIAFFIAALQAQGLHPIIAQIASITLVAFGGYFAGQNFTFSGELLSLRMAVATLAARAWQLRRAGAFFIVSMLLFDHVWGENFYIGRAYVGHDFSYSALTLLEGKNWIAANGLIAGLFNPPWFTPAWCAGTAFFADPQSAFYSPLQLLSLLYDPFFATYLCVLLFAGIAYWGSYLLARRVLGWSPAAAVVFAVLGMANAFMPMRSATGELGYQPLYLWTLLAMALCWPRTDNGWRTTFWPAIAVCLCLTAWLHYAFAGMMVPVFLATLLFCLIAVVLGRANLGAIAARAAAGAVLAIVLNASKLYESASLMRQFPRDFYALPGFTSLRDALLSIPYGLLQPSQWTADFGVRKLSGVRFAVFPHEWAMHFGLGALTIFLAALVGLLFMRQAAPRATAFTAQIVTLQSTLALAGIIAIALIPVLMLWNEGTVRNVLKSIPILNSAAWPMRWIVILLPAAQWLLAVPIALLLTRMSPRASIITAAVAAGAIWCGPVFEPIDYYLNADIQSYDPKPVINAFHRSRASGVIPITSVAFAPDGALSINRNDTMLQGASQSLCYNPIYGYRLEALPNKHRLAAGPVLAQTATGESLIVNPACLVHPAANECLPGAGFKLTNPDQLANAKLFVDRKPFAWERPGLGKALAVVSQVTFWLVLVLLLAKASRGAANLFRAKAQRVAPLP